MSINSQNFPFAPRQEGAPTTMSTQAGSIANVPLDGSAQVTVPFLNPYVQYVQSVQVQYAPSTETDYQVSVEEIASLRTVNGFTIVATGAPAGTFGNCTYIASGF